MVGISVFGVVPMAIIMMSAGVVCSVPGIGSGRRRPVSSGSHSFVLMHSIEVIQLFSSPLIRVGFVSSLKCIPSSLARSISSFLAGISSSLRR